MMGRLSELQQDRLDQRDERITEINWAEIEKITNGQLGTFKLGCPFCRKFAFQLERISVNFVKYACHYCGERGELKAANASPEKEAKALEKFKARKAAQREADRAEALRFWDSAEKLPGSPAHEYLKSRCIDDLPPNVDEVLRFHPRCRWGMGFQPVMLALRRAIKGNRPVAIQYTFSRALGERAQKRIMGDWLTPSAIKLWPMDGERLVIGEGVETVLSAALYFPRSDGAALRPAWALGPAKNTRAFPLLRNIKELNILVDQDPNQIGQKAAKACGERWAYHERKVKLFYPKNKDFNDDLMEMRGCLKKN